MRLPASVPIALLALTGLLLAGCSTAPDADDGDRSATASPSEAEPDEPEASQDEPADEPVDEPSQEEEKEDDDDTASLDEPSPFPAWMSRPVPDAGLCPTATVTVGDAEELQDALDQAGPGVVIGLEPGVYAGEFVVTESGSADDPARLCGPPDAILDGGSQTGGYVVHLDGADHWVLAGFTVRNGQKGVMADGTTGSTISGLTVYGIGDEAIHLRAASTATLVAHNTVSDTGRRRQKFGEGVYVGTAHSNWCKVSGCEPDPSHDNQVIGNAIYATSSESVDLKEGTRDGLVADNQFDGSLITGADSWLDAKGNDWRIEGNVGRSSPLDGFQTHDVSDGWGTGNVFTGNSGSLDASDGFLIALRPVNENVVRCSNTLLGSAGELSNVPCD